MKTIFAFAGAGDVIALLIGIGICVIVFLFLRFVMLWYWKIDTIVENQEAQLYTLKAILEKLSSKEENVNL